MLRLLLNLVLDVRCCFVDSSVLRRCVTSRYTYCHVLTAFYFFIYFFHSLCTESASKVYAILQLFVHLLLFFYFLVFLYNQAYRWIFIQSSLYFTSMLNHLSKGSSCFLLFIFPITYVKYCFCIFLTFGSVH